MRGSLPISLVAEFLGKTEDEVRRLIKEDGLPALKTPGNTKPSVKIVFSCFHKWLVSNSENEPITAEDLSSELDAAQVRLHDKWDAKRTKRKEAA